jgi:MtN3 and saliva related transmembrane protein
MTTEAIGLAAAALTTAAYVPQVARIVRTRSAHDISWWMFGVMAMGSTLWLVYGLRLPSLPVVAANVVTLALLTLILALKWLYGRDRRAPALRTPTG